MRSVMNAARLARAYGAPAKLGECCAHGAVYRHRRAPHGGSRGPRRR